MLLEPRCSERNCIHFQGVRNDGDESTERVFCVAFPDRIPNKIAYGKNKHTRAVKGDHGIRFEEDLEA